MYYDLTKEMSEAARMAWQAHPEAAGESARGTDVDFLWDFGYPALRDLCRIDFVAAWNVFLPVTVFRMFAKPFLRHDQVTMIQQAEGLKHNPNLMLIDDADRPAKWYFALKTNLLESRRTGAPMVHPLSEPVTLHWRS